MANRVLTNNVSLRFGIEPSPSAAPNSGFWRLIEPNQIGAFGAEITTKPRRPISPKRGRRKGAVVDLDSKVEVSGDLTLDSFTDFIEGFMFAEFANVSYELAGFRMNQAALAVSATPAYDLAGATTFATIAGGAAYGSDFVAKTIFDNTGQGAATLLYGQGYGTAGNNGFHPITAVPVGGSTEVAASGLTAEASPPANASVVAAGIRFTGTALTLSTLSGSTRTIVVNAGVAGFNWATVGVRKGMFLHLGSNNGTTGAPQNAFNASACYGYCRVRSVDSATQITIDKLDTKITGAGPFAGDATVDILIPRFARNLDVGSTGVDTLYLERTYQFEATYPGLSGDAGPPAADFEYADGNYANEFKLNFKVSDLLQIDWAFVGLTTEPIVAPGSRKTGPPAPANAITPLKTTAFGSASDIISLTTDLVTLATDVLFKDETLTIGNAETPEKALGVLGAAVVNSGPFTVDFEGQMFFSDKTITNTIRNNGTVTFAAIVKNDDGSIVMDMPAATVTDGKKDFPVDATVLANVKIQSFTDPNFGYDLGISVLVGTPTLRP